MIRTRRLAVLPLAALLSGGCAGGPAYYEAELRGAAMDIDGLMGASIRDGQISSGSTASELGLDYTAYVEPRFNMRWGDWLLSARVFTIGYTGDGTAYRQLDLGGGSPITSDTAVSTDLDLTLLSLSGMYDFLEDESWDLALGGGFGWFLYDLDVRSLEDDGRSQVNNDLPFVFVSGRVAKRLGRFELALDGRGIYWEWEYDSLGYYDLEAAVGYRLIQQQEWSGNLALGWRLVDIDYEFGLRGIRIAAEPQLNGPFLSLSVRF